MSLVGNLADLGLGDILQIISLSQKSGTLQLATPTDSGAIGFVQGKVVSAVREHAGESVADVLVNEGLAGAGVVQEILSLQVQKPQSAQSQPPLLWETYKVSIDAVEAAFKKRVEQLVFQMFAWDEGNFSFVVAEDPREVTKLKVVSSVFTVMRGLNPQYLAMEGARIKDETSRSDPFASFMARDGQLAKAKQRDQEELQQRADKMNLEPPPPDIVPSATSLGKAPPPAPLPVPVAPTLARAEPVAKAPEPPPPAPVKEEPLAEPVAAKQMRAACELILIDDDANMLRSLRTKLADKVPSLSLFTKVEAGLKRMRELLWAKRTVIVVCDLILPRSDGAGILGGLEALEKIRPDFPEVPVFLLFDYPNDEAKTKAEKLHVNGIIDKPRRTELEKDKSLAVLDEPVRVLYKAIEPFVLEAQAKAASQAEEPDEEPQEELFEKTERVAPIARSEPAPARAATDGEDEFDIAFDDEPSAPPPTPLPPDVQGEVWQRVQTITENERKQEPAPAEAAKDVWEISGKPAARGFVAPIARTGGPEPAVRAGSAQVSTSQGAGAHATAMQAAAAAAQVAAAQAAGPEAVSAKAAGASALPGLGKVPPPAPLPIQAAAPPAAFTHAPQSAAAQHAAVEAIAAQAVAIAPITLPLVTPGREPALIDLTDEAELIELTKDINIDLGDEFDARTDEPSPDRALVVLKSLLFELMSPSSRDTIMLLVLRYAAELFSRATLLLVARDELWGLGGFSHEVKTTDFVALVKRLKFTIEPSSAVAHTLKTRSAHRMPLDKTPQEQALAKALGMDPSKETFLAPLLSADRVAAVLLGDNQQVGKDLGDTHGLEIFLLQAGMAMERALLERRLKELARRES